jgi:hypothetical protein
MEEKARWQMRQFFDGLTSALHGDRKNRPEIRELAKYREEEFFEHDHAPEVIEALVNFGYSFTETGEIMLVKKS